MVDAVPFPYLFRDLVTRWRPSTIALCAPACPPVRGKALVLLQTQVSREGNTAFCEVSTALLNFFFFLPAFSLWDKRVLNMHAWNNGRRLFFMYTGDSCVVFQASPVTRTGSARFKLRPFAHWFLNIAPPKELRTRETLDWRARSGVEKP